MKSIGGSFWIADEVLDSDGQVTSVTYSKTKPLVQVDRFGDIGILDDQGLLYLWNEAARKDPPLCIDLYCGAGGASLGMQHAGFRTVGIDLDKGVCPTYQHNLDNCIRASVDSLPLRPYLEPDIVWASPPCQDFSSANKWAAMHKDGGRNFQVVVAAVQARLLHPKIVLMENVPRAAKSWQWRAATQILEAGGYGVATYLLDAVNYGVPQFRQRNIMYACRDGRILPPPRPTHGEQPPKGVSQYQYMRDLATGKRKKRFQSGGHLMAAKSFVMAESYYDGSRIDTYQEDEAKWETIDQILDALPIG